jgi:hypothetical protein
MRRYFIYLKRLLEKWKRDKLAEAVHRKLNTKYVLILAENYPKRRPGGITFAKKEKSESFNRYCMG